MEELYKDVIWIADEAARISAELLRPPPEVEVGVALLPEDCWFYTSGYGPIRLRRNDKIGPTEVVVRYPAIAELEKKA